MPYAPGVYISGFNRLTHWNMSTVYLIRHLIPESMRSVSAVGNLEDLQRVTIEGRDFFIPVDTIKRKLREHGVDVHGNYQVRDYVNDFLHRFAQSKDGEEIPDVQIRLDPDDPDSVADPFYSV